ncbi:MAG: DUF1573 domain-containing protein [Candidatus Dadabacteria bacterium]|nr:DUF1573 domain-containing protein [Candidatus Dadabacteria bacterium]
MINKFLLFLLILTPLFPTDISAADVTLNQDNIEFGSVKRGTVVKKSLQLKNNLDKELAITLIEFTVPGLIVKSKKSIPTKSSGEVTIELDTSPFNGEVKGMLKLHTNNKNDPEILIEIMGKVESRFTFEPREAIFLSAFRWETDKKEGSIILKNKDGKPFEIKKVRGDSDLFTAGFSKDEKENSYKISAKINPESEAGMTQNSLLIETEDEKIRIPVYTFLKEKVYANPPGINYGIIDKNQILAKKELLNFLNQSVFVYKHGGGDFKIEFESVPEYLNIKRTPEEGSASVINIPNQGKTDVFEIIVTPNIDKIKIGKFNDSIKLKTNDKDFPEIEFPVFGEVI